MSFEPIPPSRPLININDHPRARLWARLEAAHARLSIEPPTATLTIEDLQAEVDRLEAQAS